MNHYNIGSNVTDMTKPRLDDSTRAVILKCKMRESLRTSVGVFQGRHLSPVLFKSFRDNILTWTLADFKPAVVINGRPTSHLIFSVVAVGMDGSKSGHRRPGVRLKAVVETFDGNISVEKSVSMSTAQTSRQQPHSTVRTNR